jgi:NAD+ synthase
MSAERFPDLSRLERHIVEWLRRTVNDAKACGCVLGLSGGIDSAVVSVLCQRAFGEDMLTVIMPCHSTPDDEADAARMVELFRFPSIRMDLSAIYDTVSNSLSQYLGTHSPELALANIKPRLRMITLYSLAQSRNYLVCGTGNKVELTVGYFTKYGDAGVDLLPIGDLLKGDVRRLARYLGIPAQIIDKPPSAGLWSGQTDEGEMGVTYEELDSFILSGKGSEKVRAFVNEANARSEHKRKVPPVCDTTGL